MAFHYLGDYLFPSDMERFNLDNFNKSLEWSNQAVSKEQKLQNDLDVISRNTMAFHYLGDDLKYRPSSSTHPTQNEEVMNENYAKAFHPASRRTGNNAASNKNLHKPGGKKVRNSKKSSLFNENRSSHEEEKIKIPDNFSTEQEYQNQMNKIFNNPEYFNQVAHQLQENHQEQQHPYPSMYIIPLEMESQMILEPSVESHQHLHQIDNNTPVTILSDTSYSDEIK